MPSFTPIETNLRRTPSTIKFVPSAISEHESQKRKKNSAILILLKTTGQDEVKISIDPNKTMGELIKSYFNKIKRKDLYGDESIIFMKNAKVISHNSSELIKTYFEGLNEGNVIVITDLDDKIKSTFNNI